MSGGYALVCTVCGASLESRSGWLEHLLEEPHQRVAQAQVATSWTRKIRKCCLVLFASFPVVSVSPSDGGGGGGGGGLQLLEHFSNKGSFPQIIVTDFVCIPGKPCVAVVQFESKEVVSDVLEKVGGPKMSVNGQMVQIRMGKDYLDLEWNAIVTNIAEPGPAPPCKTGMVEEKGISRKGKGMMEESNNEGGGGGGDGKEKRILSGSPPPPPPPPPGALEVTKVSKSSQQPEQPPQPQEEAKRTTEIISGPSSSSPTPRIPTITCDLVLLRSQYSSLCAEVLIPDAQFQSATRLMHKLETGFIWKYPAFKLYMFRTWALQLKNLGDDRLHFYPDFQGELSGCPTSTTLTFARHEIESSIGPNILKHELPPYFQVGQEVRKECYLEPETGLKFSIDLTAWSQEVQSCRLLSYLSTFDTRARPLLQLVTYWSLVNKISLSTRTVDDFCRECIPLPTDLQWLVLLFLARKKLIPTPREITENPPTNYPIVKTKFGYNIGFTCDEEYALQQRKSKSVPPEESDRFLIDVITLAKEFFCTFAGLGSPGSSWILNTRDGEILNQADFVSEAPRPSSFQTRLTRFEMSELISRRFDPRSCYPSTKRPHGVVLLPPFCVYSTYYGESFSSGTFTDSVCPKMKQTCDQLEGYLSNNIKNQAGSNSLTSVLHVLV